MHSLTHGTLEMGKHGGMPLEEVAYQRGVTDAQADITAKACRLFWGTRGRWGELFTELMQRRFGVQVVHISDITSTGEWSYQRGYNETIKSHVDSEFGAGSFERAWNEIREYRQETARRWSESQTNPTKADRRTESPIKKARERDRSDDCGKSFVGHSRHPDIPYLDSTLSSSDMHTTCGTLSVPSVASFANLCALRVLCGSPCLFRRAGF